MFVPGYGQTAKPEDTAEIMLNSHEYFGFCDTFKYLGTTFDKNLNDSTDIQKRIQKATGAYAFMAKLLKNDRISKQLRIRAYEATVLNILLFGCESWALKVEDKRKLEARHHRFLRSMLNLTMHNVKEQRIRNSSIRQQLQCYSLHQTMELRRSRWLEKLAKMPDTRNPRKIFVAWTPNPRPTGRPFQTIRDAYAHTLESTLELDPRLKSWMPLARDENRQWADRVEKQLELRPNAYVLYTH